MKLLAVVLAAFFSIKCSSQNFKKLADTAIYTFKLQLEAPLLRFTPCIKEAHSEILSYRVIESNYKIPLTYVYITHRCPDPFIFQNNRVYSVKATVQTVDHGATDFFNTARPSSFLTCVSFIPDFIYKVSN